MEGETLANPAFFQPILPEFLLADEEIDALKIAFAVAEKSLIPAIPELIITVLTKLSIHYWQGGKDERGWSSMMEDYLEDLEHVPADLLQDACRRYRRNPSNRFFPKSADILLIVAPGIRARRMQFERVKKMLQPRAITSQKTQTDREEMAKKINELGKELAMGLRA